MAMRVFVSEFSKRMTVVAVKSRSCFKAKFVDDSTRQSRGFTHKRKGLILGVQKYDL